MSDHQEETLERSAQEKGVDLLGDLLESIYAARAEREVAARSLHDQEDAPDGR